MLRKILLIIALLSVGCEETKNPTIIDWFCTTDYHSDNDFQLEECLSINGKEIPCPEIRDPITSELLIYNSIEECEAVCPDSVLLSLDGTDEYIGMYCTGKQ